MSTSTAEASVQQPQVNPAVGAMLTDNPQITSDFLTNLEDIDPEKFPEMLSQAKADGVASAEKPAPATATPETPAETETPTAEETSQPEAETATTVETPTAETETPPVTPENPPAQTAPKETPEKPETEEHEIEPKRVKLQLHKMEPLSRKVTMLMATGMTAEAALAEAKSQLGVKPTDTAPAPDPVTAAEKELEAAMTEHAKATSEFRTDDVGPALLKVLEAKDKVTAAKETVKSTENAFQTSVAKAKAEWPDAATTNTVFGRAVRDLLYEVRENPQHPLHNDPDAAYKVTESIAKELGKPGKSAATAALTTPPVPPAVPPKVATKPKPAPPVSGATRTVVPKPTPEAEARAKAKELLGDDAHLLDACVPA